MIIENLVHSPREQWAELILKNWLAGMYVDDTFGTSRHDPDAGTLTVSYADLKKLEAKIARALELAAVST